MEGVTNESLLMLGVRIVFGLVASVAAMAVWSRSREPGLVFLILGTVLNYVEVLFAFLDLLGILPYASYQIFGISWIKIGFAVTIPLLITVGFVMIFRSYDKF